MNDLEERISIEWEQMAIAFRDLRESSWDLDSQSPIAVAGLAAYLVDLYGGIENILKQIVRSRERFLRSESWHKDLLTRALALGIIDHSLAKNLEAWLQFRHFSRHGYSFRIDKCKLDKGLQAAGPVLAQFRDCINAYMVNHVEGFTSLPAIHASSQVRKVDAP